MCVCVCVCVCARARAGNESNGIFFLLTVLNFSDPRDQTLEFEWHEIDGRT